MYTDIYYFSPPSILRVTIRFKMFYFAFTYGKMCITKTIKYFELSKEIEVEWWNGGLKRKVKF